MKVMAISFIFVILFIGFVCALSINFDIPEKIYSGKEFYVNIINVDVSGNFDVKIYVKDKIGETVSKIYNDNWQNSIYYVQSAYPAKDSFKVIVENYTGQGELCVKLRENGKSSALGEACRNIEILKSEEKNKNTVVSGWAINNNNISSEMAVPLKEDNEKIVLEPKKVYYTSYYKTRLILIYGFVILCVLLIILLSLRKL